MDKDAEWIGAREKVRGKGEGVMCRENEMKRGIGERKAEMK